MAEDNIGEIFVTIKADVKQLEDEVKALKAKMDKDAEKIGASFGDTFKKGLQLAGGFLGLQTALNFGKSIINTASEFEQLHTRLVSLYGSTEKAGDVFEQFKQIAATTPFSLKGTVEAGATLKAFGMNAENTLKSVTDLAAYMGMDVVEAANAVGRAFAGGAGAADILRERGVLNLIKDFKGVDDLTKLTLPQFREALQQAMVDPAVGIVGSTDRLSKTFQGSFSNMMDSVDKFANFIGSKLLPVFGPVIRTITNMLDSWTKEEDAIAKVTRKAEEQISTFNVLANRYELLAQKTELSANEKKLYSETIRELQKLYPNYLQNIDLEKGKFEDNVKAINAARESLEKYLEAQIYYAMAQKNMDALVKKGEELYRIEKLIADVKAKPVFSVDDKGNLQGVQKQTEAQEKLTTAQQKFNQGMLVINEKRRQQLEDEKKRLLNETEDLRKKADAIMQVVAAPKTAATTTVTTAGLTEKEIKKHLDALKDEVDALKDLDVGTEKYRSKAIELIKAETAEMIKNGVAKDIALAKEKQAITEVEVEYLRAKAAKDIFYKKEYEGASNENLLKTPNIPKALNIKPPKEIEEIDKDVDARTKREEKRDEDPLRQSSKLQPYYDMLKEGGPFSGENLFVNTVETSMATATGFVDGFFQQAVIKGEWANSMLEQGFVSMANACIAQLERIAAAWVTNFAIEGIFSLFGLPIPGIGKEAGDLLGNIGATHAASGANFIVPPGFDNDNYPMFVKSGERVNVTPANQVGEQERLLNTLIGRIDVLNYNLIQSSSDKTTKLNVTVGGEIDGSTILLAQHRADRQRRRMN